MKVLVTGGAGFIGSHTLDALRARGDTTALLDDFNDFYDPAVKRRHAAATGARIFEADLRDRPAVRAALQAFRPDAILHLAARAGIRASIQNPALYIDTNVTGTLNLLEEAVAAGVKSFVYTSTTSVFGAALVPPVGAPAAWVTEDVAPVPKNIYGVTKAVAEDLCQLFHRNQRLPSIVLRTSRFFPEEDDDRTVRDAYADDNAKANEYLHRRVDVEDVVSAHLLAARQAPSLGFRRYIVSATTPFSTDDLADLRRDAPSMVHRRVPHYEAEYARRHWTMVPSIDRVYVNARARAELGWRPRYDFAFVIERLAAGQDFRSPLARLVGAKGYHAETFAEGPYPVE